MKKFAFLFFLFILFWNQVYLQCPPTTLMFNVLDVEFDRPNNEFVISGLECDPCEYVTSRGVCECNLDCDKQYDNCVEICQNNTNPFELAQCLDVCIASRLSCYDRCGTTEPTRFATEFFFGMALWYTTGFVETFDGPPNFVSETNSGNGSPPDPIIIPVTHDLTNISISYCYQTRVFVVYNDGTCCDFINEKCVQLG